MAEIQELDEEREGVWTQPVRQFKLLHVVFLLVTFVLIHHIFQEPRPDLEYELMAHKLLSSQFQNQIASARLSRGAVGHCCFVLLIEKSQTVVSCRWHFFTCQYALQHNQRN